MSCRMPIRGGGTIDAIDTPYLTIEYRGELPDSVDLGNRIYGCDTCQRCVPTTAEPSH